MSRARGVTLDEMINRMPPEDQREVAERAAVLIAQHMALHGDMLLSTLRGYVEAMGGRVTLNVQMPGLPPVELDGLRDLASEMKGATKAGRTRRAVAA